MDEKPFSQYSIQIATPFGDGKADIEYALSVTNTFQLLEHFGARVDWARMPGCSDLPFARNKIFGNFLRGPHTHLMLVDSDMGWEAGDVVKMLLAKKDFIAGVGCKKTWPLEFAMNNCDDNGNTLMIEYQSDANLGPIMEISEVGMAFVLLTKACVIKMADYYKESLEYYIPDQPSEIDIFGPFIIPGTKRRLPEDFAFCHRWRKIGGKIYLMPYIRLTHSGKHTWSGALSDTFAEFQNEKEKTQ